MGLVDRSTRSLVQRNRGRRDDQRNRLRFPPLSNGGYGSTQSAANYCKDCEAQCQKNYLKTDSPWLAFSYWIGFVHDEYRNICIRHLPCRRHWWRHPPLIEWFAANTPEKGLGTRQKTGKWNESCDSTDRGFPGVYTVRTNEETIQCGTKKDELDFVIGAGYPMFSCRIESSSFRKDAILSNKHKIEHSENCADYGNFIFLPLSHSARWLLKAARNAQLQGGTRF